jgi:hypothetical protein
MAYPEIGLVLSASLAVIRCALGYGNFCERILLSVSSFDNAPTTSSTRSLSRLYSLTFFFSPSQIHMSQSKHTIRECLESIGIVSDADFAACVSVNEEFQVVKRKAHECFLRTHPDKGGDAAEFRKARTSFEVLRGLFDSKKVSTFQGIAVQKQNADSYNAVYAEFGDVPTPSWDYFYAAASEVVPLYRIEVAKSGRSRCVAKSGRTCTEDPKETCFIAQGEVRIGSMLADVGSYTRFVHLQCWRVPNRIWEGLPKPEECDDPEKFAHALRQMNEVILVGFSDLSEEQQNDVVTYVMDKSHWARKTKKRGGLLMSDGTNNGVQIADGTVVSEDAVGEYQSRGMVPAGPPRERFVVPIPGKNGAVPNALEGKVSVEGRCAVVCCVLWGGILIFPSILLLFL